MQVSDFLEGVNLSSLDAADLVFLAELLLDAEDLPKTLAFDGWEIMDLRRFLSAALADAKAEAYVKMAAISRIRAVLRQLQVLAAQQQRNPHAPSPLSAS